MKIINILEEMEKVDPYIYDRLSPRRNAMKEFFKMGSKVAITAMPMALGSMFKKAYGQTIPAGILAVLQYALTLEHFEAAFYTAFAGGPLVPAGNERNTIVALRDSEVKHVDFLKTVITAGGATPVAAKATYDFTAGGTFATILTSYPVFLAVAQVIEDTGVRAYKGRAGELVGQKVYLTAALGIHAVEARHAAKIRYLRRTLGQAASNKPWISGGNDTGLTAADKTYGGTISEANVTQANILITNINGQTISAINAAEAFDEPLTATEVLDIVRPFGVS